MRYPAIIKPDSQEIVAVFPHLDGCRVRVKAGQDVHAAAAVALSACLAEKLTRGGVPFPAVPVRRGVPAGARLVGIPVAPLLAVRIQLRWARHDAGLSQRRLAQRLGVSQQQVAQMESAGANLTLARLVEVAALLGRSVEIDLIPSAPKL